MKRWTAWLSWLLIFSLILGCSNAGSYVKDNYPLVDVQGKGKETSKVYLVEGKDVPTVANELASKEKPEEKSKEDPDQMFLAYKDKIVQIEKDPANEKNSLVEVNSIEYAKKHYDSSFLKGYLTASIIQSIFGGGGFFGNLFGGGGGSYKGYSSLPDSSRKSTDPSQFPSSSNTKKPSTSDGSGSFNTKKTEPSTSTAPKTGSSGSGSSGSFNTKPSTAPKSSSSNSGSSSKSGSSSSSTRKSDGSSPTYKSPKKPSTSSRSGSFSRKR